MYQQASRAGAGGGAEGAAKEAASGPEEEVVDADFEEVKDDKK
jgi:hypothetical protein